MPGQVWRQPDRTVTNRMEHPQTFPAREGNREIEHEPREKIRIIFARGAFVEKTGNAILDFFQSADRMDDRDRSENLRDKVLQSARLERLARRRVMVASSGRREQADAVGATTP